jgi:hypothetical protein
MSDELAGLLWLCGGMACLALLGAAVYLFGRAVDPGDVTTALACTAVLFALFAAATSRS